MRNSIYSILNYYLKRGVISTESRAAAEVERSFSRNGEILRLCKTFRFAPLRMTQLHLKDAG
jgi:hypothetical protein